MVKQLQFKVGKAEQKMLNWLSIISLLLVITSCSNPVDETGSESKDEDGFAWRIDAKAISGFTQGSSFEVKTSDDSLFLSVPEIEAILLGFDSELSGYDSTSLLSEINACDTSIKIPENSYFDSCYFKSLEIYNRTSGYFDPSVFPLVRTWGFFKDSAIMLTEDEVDSCLTFISFEPEKNHSYANHLFIKKDHRFEIDFNAIAQGYSVDVLADILEEKGQQNYYIEIGGEVRVKGVNADNKSWVLGIDVPADENTGVGERALENYISVNSGAIATSGNYRKFYIIDGKKYSHTLDPKTGFSVKHSLLSATVKANDCATADAYATAFMVMGKDKTLDFLSNNLDLDLEVYLLFQNEAGRIERAYSTGMAKLLLQ